MNKSLKVIALIAAVVSIVPLEATKKRRGGCRNGMCGVRVAPVIPVAPTVAVKPVVVASAALVEVAPESVVKKTMVNKVALLGTVSGNISLVTDPATDETNEERTEKAVEVVTTLSV